MKDTWTLLGMVGCVAVVAIATLLMQPTGDLAGQATAPSFHGDYDMHINKSSYSEVDVRSPMYKAQADAHKAKGKEMMREKLAKAKLSPQLRQEISKYGWTTSQYLQAEGTCEDNCDYDCCGMPPYCDRHC